MPYRQVWGRQSWTNALTRQCEEMGHDPVPCEAHLAEIEASVARSEEELQSPEMQQNLADFVRQHHRKDEPMSERLQALLAKYPARGG